MRVPRWTVWVYTDRGDIPRGTSDRTMLATLITEARRSILVGTIVVDDNGTEVASGSPDTPDGYTPLDHYLTTV